MASPGTLKTEYPIIKHIPAALAKAKAQAAAARDLPEENNETPPKKRSRSLVCTSWQGARNSRLPVPDGSRYGHDQQRGQ